MLKDVVILLAEDDAGHAGLIRKNLTRAGIVNELLHFEDGAEVLDFLFKRGDGRQRQSGLKYVLLLDIRMPNVDGFEVLRQVKSDPMLRTIPVIMITTTDDPLEIKRCHELGCNNYITKPVDHEKFVNAIRQLGYFLAVVEVPKTDGEGTI